MGKASEADGFEAGKEVRIAGVRFVEKVQGVEKPTTFVAGDDIVRDEIAGGQLFQGRLYS